MCDARSTWHRAAQPVVALTFANIHTLAFTHAFRHINSRELPAVADLNIYPSPSTSTSNHVLSATLFPLCCRRVVSFLFDRRSDLRSRRPTVHCRLLTMFINYASVYTVAHSCDCRRSETHLSHRQIRLRVRASRRPARLGSCVRREHLMQRITLRGFRRFCVCTFCVRRTYSSNDLEPLR